VKIIIIFIRIQVHYIIHHHSPHQHHINLRYLIDQQGELVIPMVKMVELVVVLLRLLLVTILPYQVLLMLMVLMEVMVEMEVKIHILANVVMIGMLMTMRGHIVEQAVAVVVLAVALAVEL